MGADHGTVILDAHTYHDDSAILKTSFPQKAHVGMAIQLHCADDRSRSYAATEVTVDLTVHSYPPLVESGRLYASDGPPQLVLVTCTDWSAARRDWDKRAIIIATPQPDPAARTGSAEMVLSAETLRPSIVATSHRGTTQAYAVQQLERHPMR